MTTSEEQGVPLGHVHCTLITNYTSPLVCRKSPRSHNAPELLCTLQRWRCPWPPFLLVPAPLLQRGSPLSTDAFVYFFVVRLKSGKDITLWYSESVSCSQKNWRHHHVRR
ncbi:unnamed protein product [Sphagnum jensenii]|uniref:Uncharacterized protein n=1 Tax=Sphagnum jensenii TaxID=128206 RepID=A0ABP1C0X5_9BRYO